MNDAVVGGLSLDGGLVLDGLAERNEAEEDEGDKCFFHSSLNSNNTRCE